MSTADQLGEMVADLVAVNRRSPLPLPLRLAALRRGVCVCLCETIDEGNDDEVTFGDNLNETRAHDKVSLKLIGKKKYRGNKLNSPMATNRLGLVCWPNADNRQVRETPIKQPDCRARLVQSNEQPF